MAQTSRASSRVLIADSDPLTRDELALVVRNEGYEVVTVNDGREALRVLASDADFRLAIFEMVMPHDNGPEVARRMKTDPRLMSIPVVMITSDIGFKLMTDGFAAGASVFLFKPVTAIKLQRILKMFLHPTGRAKRFSPHPPVEIN